MATGIKEPPVLTGDAAEKNRALRALSGKYTEADLALHHWCIVELPFECWKVSPVNNGVMKVASCEYMGKTLWPPE